MSKSGLRVIGMVALLGAAGLGILYWQGARQVQHGSEEPTSPAPTLPAAVAEPEPARRLTRVVEQEAPAPVALPAEGSAVASPPPAPTFIVCAMIRNHDGHMRVGLVSDTDSQYALIGEKEAFLGYEVATIDYEQESVALTRGGYRFMLKLNQGRAARPAAVKDPNEDTAGKEAWLASLNMTPLEATADEAARGIDPEDPSTWPQGYRGPGIEQSLAEAEARQQSGGRAQPFIMSDLFLFEPMRKELEDSIDPNDPGSWPESYKGPGIERAVLPKEETAKWLNTVRSNLQEMLPEAQTTYEPTADEIARGIDPNDATTWPDGYRGAGIERSLQKEE